MSPHPFHPPFCNRVISLTQLLSPFALDRHNDVQLSESQPTDSNGGKCSAKPAKHSKSILKKADHFSAGTHLKGAHHPEEMEHLLPEVTVEGSPLLATNHRQMTMPMLGLSPSKGTTEMKQLEREKSAQMMELLNSRLVNAVQAPVMLNANDRNPLKSRLTIDSHHQKQQIRCSNDACAFYQEAPNTGTPCCASCGHAIQLTPSSRPHSAPMTPDLSHSGNRLLHS